MEPVLNIGDIVFIKPTRIEDVRVGEIIAFYASPKTVIVHRVQEIIAYPSRIYLLTKGDANDLKDQAVGLGPVTEKNLLGKALSIDGIPLKVPYIGQIWAHLYNLSVWVTQDKPWSFWAPVLAALYICWPSGKRGRKVFQKPLLKRKIHKKQLLIISFTAFAAISIFTMWFRSEQYTLGMRIACLEDFDEKMNFNYGSMIYGQREDHTITITGAPMLPVKTVSVVLGNASRIATTVPRSTIAEPNKYLDLTLHAEIPPFGSIMPGLYRGVVFVYSSYLWTLLPDELIFAVFGASPNPWFSTVILEVTGALLAAGLFLSAIYLGEFIVRQALYTYIWLQHRPEEEPVPSYILRIRSVKASLRTRLSGLKHRMVMAVAVFDVKGVLQKMEIFSGLGIAAYAIYAASHSFILTLAVECGIGVAFAVLRRWRLGAAVVGVVFTHIVASLALVAQNAVLSARSLFDIWSVSASGFTGAIESVTTIPLVVLGSIATYKALSSAKVWYLEQETLGWTIIKKVVLTIPSFERQTQEVIPEKIDVLRHRILTIRAFAQPRQLTAESCQVLKPQEEVDLTPRRMSADEYRQIAKLIRVLEEAPREARRLEASSPYWTSRLVEEPVLIVGRS